MGLAHDYPPSLSQKLINAMREEERLSIRDGIERLSLWCGDDLKPIASTWHDNRILHTNLTRDTIVNACGGKSAKVVHTHMQHTAHPSKMDFDALNRLQIANVEGMCVIGLDGIGCYDLEKQKEIMFRSWTSAELTEDMHKLGGKVWHGKHVYCDGDKEILCEIDGGDGSPPEQMGIFKHIVLRGGTIYRKNDADLAMQTHFADEHVRCSAIDGKDTIFCEVIPHD